jgi:hypothetical protein
MVFEGALQLRAGFQVKEEEICRKWKCVHCAAVA